MPAQRGWRGDLLPPRGGAPDLSESPGTARSKGGREELNHEWRESKKRLPVRPIGDGAEPQRVHTDGYPRFSAFYSGKTWLLAKGARVTMPG